MPLSVPLLNLPRIPVGTRTIVWETLKAEAYWLLVSACPPPPGRNTGRGGAPSRLNSVRVLRWRLLDLHRISEVILKT
jgi:hypothetical protein